MRPALNRQATIESMLVLFEETNYANRWTKSTLCVTNIRNSLVFTVNSNYLSNNQIIEFSS